MKRSAPRGPGEGSYLWLMTLVSLVFKTYETFVSLCVAQVNTVEGMMALIEGRRKTVLNPGAEG